MKNYLPKINPKYVTLFILYSLKEKRELEMSLLQADERYAIFRNEFKGVEQLIPQYHIASYLGISATQLSRIRNKMTSKPKSLPM